MGVTADEERRLEEGRNRGLAFCRKDATLTASKRLVKGRR